MHVGAHFFAQQAHILAFGVLAPLVGQQRRQQMIKAVMILGDFLILQRERQHRFIAQLHLRVGGQAPFRRPLDRYIIRRRRFRLLFLGAVRPFEVGHQEQRNLRQRRGNRGRQRAHRFLQILLQILLRHRHGSAEVGERGAERDHLSAKPLRELADAQLGKNKWGRHEWHFHCIPPVQPPRAVKPKIVCVGSSASS